MPVIWHCAPSVKAYGSERQVKNVSDILIGSPTASPLTYTMASFLTESVLTVTVVQFVVSQVYSKVFASIQACFSSSEFPGAISILLTWICMQPFQGVI